MARTAQLAMRGFGGRVRFWGDVLSGAKYRVFELLGALLVLPSLLLLLALLTYFPGDASFDTAVAAPPRNYLGYDGAVIADILMQSVGFAAYLLPAVLLGWAFRLMLRRPIHRFAKRVAILLGTAGQRRPAGRRRRRGRLGSAAAHDNRGARAAGAADRDDGIGARRAAAPVGD